MATTISTQDLLNARRDIDDIGKAVNENTIVSPRYGDDFKSIPMLAAEAQTAINGWQDAINTIVVDDGVPALAVSDASGLNQQEVNNGVESIADLLAIPNPKNGNRVYVKSYHAGLNSGGGYFTYENSRASENDGGTVINGWVREVNDDAIMPAWFGVRTDGTDDPLNPNHELLQNAIDAGFKSFDFGGEDSVYLFNGQVGVIHQSFYSKTAYTFEASGATVITEGEYAWLTTKPVKDNGGIMPSTPNRYSGKFFIKGFNFRGGNTRGVFDGDFLYNVMFTNNDCSSMNNVTTSFQGSSAYPGGYFQSVYLVNNHFNSVKTVMQGNKGYNILVDGNTFEGCTGGIFINGSGQPAINVIRLTNNVFEGGGMFAYLGDTISGVISNNYLETNKIGLTTTKKCVILLDRTSSGTYLANFTITNNMYSAETEQNNDEEFSFIRFDNYGTQHLEKVIIASNWTSTKLSSHTVGTSYANTTGTAKQQANLYGTPLNVSKNFKSKSYSVALSSSAVSADSIRVLKFRHTDSSISYGTSVDIRLQCEFVTASGGNISNGFIGFTAYLYTAGYSLGLGRNINALIGNPLVMFQGADVKLGNGVAGYTTSAPFTSPEITISPSEESGVFEVWVSGYTKPTATNFGAAAELKVLAKAEIYSGWTTGTTDKASLFELN